MSFKGPVINKLNGGLGLTNPTDDGVMALAYVVPEDDLPVDIEHNKGYELLQAKDADALGFDAAFDANNSSLVNHAIAAFFNYAPSGKLFLIPVAESQTPVQIMTLAAFRQAIRDNATIKGIAIGGTTETAAALAAMVDPVQVQIDAFATNDMRLIDFVILQGNGATGTTAVSAYTDLRAKAAPCVLVSVAQDPVIAAIDADYAKYADVGSVLGMAAVRLVSESWGSVDIANKPSIKKGNENYPLTLGDQWTEAALSDGTKVSSLTLADLKALTDKGYTFAGAYPGYPGVYLNDCPTCVEAASDYAYPEYNRTWNKAARGIRAALMPKMNGKLKKDPTTGYIRSTTISNFENIARKPLDAMVIADEISGGTVYIDPKQIVNAQSPLKVKAQAQVDDIVHDIDIDLGLSTKAS